MRSVRAFGAIAVLGVASCQLLAGIGNPDLREPGSGGTSSSSSSASSASSSGTGGTGGAGGCSMSQTHSCYDGPPGTAGQGLCQAGTQSCDGNGTWGPCMNQVLPVTEDCSKLGDEDCDGYACSETIWAALYGDTGSQSVRATASDSAGNIMVTGQLDGSITFGTTMLVSSGPYDIYLARLDKDGNAIWAKQYGSPMGPRTPHGVRVDPAGNVILAGYFSGSMAFGNTTLTATDYDVFVAKIAANGTPMWAKQFGSSPGDQKAYGLAVDAAGNIALAGYFDGTLDFGCGAIASGGNFLTGFVAKLDTDGNCVFTNQLVLSGQMNSVTFDTSGNVVAAGEVMNGASYDWFIIRYDGVGNLAWSQMMGSDVADDEAKSVAVDSAGNIYVTGYFQSTFVVASDPSKNLVSAGGQDVALIKLQPTSGSILWTKRFGDASNQIGMGVAVDKHDGVVVTGDFGGSISFGGATHTETFGSTDAFLAKFRPDGTFVWSRSYGGSGADAIQSVSISLDDTILFGESTYGPTIDLGTGPLTVTGTTAGALAKIAP